MRYRPEIDGLRAVAVLPVVGAAFVAEMIAEQVPARVQTSEK